MIGSIRGLLEEPDVLQVVAVVAVVVVVIKNLCICLGSPFPLNCLLHYYRLSLCWFL